MEEDIAILLQLINTTHTQVYAENFNKIDLAIEHLIKSYKELEEENEELKAKAEIRLYISGMRNGKELLQKTLANYNDLSIKALKLQSITSYTIDDLIDLFLKGYTLQKDYIPTSLVKEKIEELKEIADEDNKDEYIKIQVLQELLREE